MNDRSRRETGMHSGNPELMDALEKIFPLIREGNESKVESYLQTVPDLENELREYIATMRVMGDLDHQEGVEASFLTHAESVNVAEAIGDFRIVREVGRGGMGVVYEAQQGSLDRRVALKLLPMASLASESQVRRFKNEARAAATLHHPNIVPVYSVGSDKGQHYFAMQYIEGTTLAHLIDALAQDPNVRPSSLNATEPTIHF